MTPQARYGLRGDGCTEVVAPKVPWRIAFRSEQINGSTEIVELHLSPIEGHKWSDVAMTDRKLSALLQGLKVMGDDSVLGATAVDRLTAKFDVMEQQMTPRVKGRQPVRKSTLRQCARIVRNSSSMEAAYAAIQEAFFCGRKNAEKLVKQAREVGLPCDPIGRSKRKTS